MKTTSDRLDELEIFVSSQERMLEELNAEVLRQAKIIDALIIQTKMLISSAKESAVKPLSEETPPPHY